MAETVEFPDIGTIKADEIKKRLREILERYDRLNPGANFVARYETIIQKIPTKATKLTVAERQRVFMFDLYTFFGTQVKERDKDKEGYTFPETYKPGRSMRGEVSTGSESESITTETSDGDEGGGVVVDEIEKTNNELSNTVAKLKIDIETLEKELQESKTKNATINDLEETVRDIKYHNENLKKEVESITNNIKKLENDNRQLLSEGEEKEQQIVKLNDRLNELELENANIKKQNEALIKEQEKIVIQQGGGEEDVIKKAENIVASGSNDQDLEALSIEVIKAQNKNKENETVIKSLQDELLNSTGKNGELEKEIDRLNQEISSLKKENELSKEKIRELDDERIEMFNDSNFKKAQLHIADLKIEEYVRLGTEKDEKIEELESIVEERGNLVKIARIEQDRLKSTIEGLKEENAELILKLEQSESGSREEESELRKKLDRLFAYENLVVSYPRTVFGIVSEYSGKVLKDYNDQLGNITIITDNPDDDENSIRAVKKIIDTYGKIGAVDIFRDLSTSDPVPFPHMKDDVADYNVAITQQGLEYIKTASRTRVTKSTGAILPLTTETRFMNIGDYAEKNVFERFSDPHIGTNQLELTFRDKTGAKTLHMVVSNLDPHLTSDYDTGRKLIANIGKSGKHVLHKYITHMGRDVIYSEGSLTLERHDAGLKLPPETYRYSIHSPASHEEIGAGVITTLGGDGEIKLYTKHVAVNVAEVDMIVMPF